MTPEPNLMVLKIHLRLNLHSYVAKDWLTKSKEFLCISLKWRNSRVPWSILYFVRVGHPCMSVLSDRMLYSEIGESSVGSRERHQTSNKEADQVTPENIRHSAGLVGKVVAAR